MTSIKTLLAAALIVGSSTVAFAEENGSTAASEPVGMTYTIPGAVSAAPAVGDDGDLKDFQDSAGARPVQNAGARVAPAYGEGVR